MTFRQVSTLTLLTLLSTSLVSAGVISTTGMVQQIAAPASVAPNAGVESDAAASLFQEQAAMALISSLTMDITAPGVYQSNASLTTGTLNAGVLVSSFYLHIDPVGTPTTGITYTGSITFDTPVLGIALLDPQLLSSQAVLGAPGTFYSTSGKQFELTTGETVTLSADRRTVTFSAGAGPGSDDLRIVTSAVPEPSAVLLVGAGVAVLFTISRTKQRR